ncbi:MAG: NADH-quinone oxidoreductase subunit NuoG, partial [Alphaproteobacteria bacterium]|nr:NADH-quinone oxidoreductase subunit NuoG [Alphaproteobacteria bacterium]
MINVTINDKKIKIEEGSSIIQACEKAGVEVPRFCYHEKLKVAGNCRMCLVDVEGRNKPVASCAANVHEDMVVKTNTPVVKKAREGVMEFLLANHPLDCPICDQGGECDLQDQAMKYGSGKSRFSEDKRAVKDKYMGPLIKTHMTRCIHCTRCIRFATDVAGVEELGAFGRGEDMEVSTYVGKAITSELSGNMIDICPVGALTSKPYAFKARSWELKKTETIDVSDAVGSNIRVDTRGQEVFRVLPRLHEEINEEWISDKTRFSYDGLKNQRLDRPYIRLDGVLKPSSWEEAVALITKRLSRLKGKEIGAIVGDMADAESITVLKDIMKHYSSPNMDCLPDGIYMDTKHRSSYLFNTTISGIEESDFCLLVGADPRHEATMVNARLKKRSMLGNFKVFSIGNEVDLTYQVENLGSDVGILKDIASGKHKISSALKSAKKPMIIIGYGALARSDSCALLKLCDQIVSKYKFIQKDWNGFNVLHLASSTVAALDLKFIPQTGGMNARNMINSVVNTDLKFLYLLGADGVNTSNIKNKSFVVYQGHHGDRAAHVADVVLPGAAFTEKNATYVNLEGRAQRTKICTNPPGDAKEDWEILRNIADKSGVKLKYNSKSELRDYMCSISTSFSKLDYVHKEEWKGCGEKGKLLDEKISNIEINYYMSN